MQNFVVSSLVSQTSKEHEDKSLVPAAIQEQLLILSVPSPAPLFDLGSETTIAAEIQGFCFVLVVVLTEMTNQPGAIILPWPR